MKQGILCIEDKVRKESFVGREKAEKPGLGLKRAVGVDQ